MSLLYEFFDQIFAIKKIINEQHKLLPYYAVKKDNNVKKIITSIVSMNQEVQKKEK